MTDLTMTVIQCGVGALAAAIVWRLRSADALGTRAALTVLAAGLSAAAFLHIEMLFTRGLVVFRRQPMAFNIYWTSLSVFDPLGALLLVVWPRAGVALTLAIMLSDVAVNLTANRGIPFFSPVAWRLWCQIAYGLFAFVVARRISRAPPLWASPPARS